MSELQIIDQRKVLGHDFRIYGDFENPLFRAKDIAEWIEHTNPRAMLQSIDKTEKVVNIVYTPGGVQESLFLTEDGLYEVLMLSRKPIAKEFKKKVKEILRSIRKHGAYMTPDTLSRMISSPEFGIRLLTALKEEQDKNVELTEKVERDQPLVAFANAVSASKTTILVGELAKLLRQNGIEIGQNRLFQWLRDNGYLIRRQGTDYNMPTQRSMELKLFEIKETSISHDGYVSISKTPKVTGKGQIYFINKFQSA